MFHWLGKFISRAWPVVILAWVALAVGVHWVAPAWDSVTNDGDLAYLPARMTTVRGESMLRQAFPDDKTKSQLALVVARGDADLSADDLAWTDRLAERFAPEQQPELPIVDVWSPSSEVVGAKLKSKDGRAALVVVHISNEFMAASNVVLLEKTKAVLDELRTAADFPPGLELGISGSAAIGGDMLASARESIQNTEKATVALVLIILLFVYRAPMLVVIPLATIILSVAVATDLVALLTQAHKLPGFEWVDFKIFKTTRIFVVVILFGSGTDFCLFLISRYKEELARGLDRRRALAESLGQVGEALAGSAATTIFGLGMMFFADFGKFRNSGPAIALCLAVTLLACLTLAPALLRLFSRVVFWPFGVKPAPAVDSARQTAPEPSAGFWGWTARAILARPGLILVVSTLLLAPLAYAGLQVDISYDMLAEMQPSRASAMGTRLLRQHFAAGETGPLTVLALKKHDGNFDQKEGEQEIARLTKLLYDLEGVESVRSIAEPLGDKPGLSSPFSPAGRRKIAARKHPTTVATFLTPVETLKGKVARLDIVLEHDPFSKDAVATFDRIERELMALAAKPDSPWHGTEFDFVGATAGTRDLREVTESDQALIQKLVTIVVLGVLLVIVRRPVICLFLIVSVLFSYYVTIGATELAFGWYYESFDGLDWKVPLFLFVILVAVGEDYNIYLVTRVVEEQRRWGPLEGLRLATEKTGGIITSCGVIMAGTFVSMMTGTLRGMLELGFALSLGVVLDTFIVRPVLVPAFMALQIRLRGDDKRPPPAAEDSSALDNGAPSHAEKPRPALSKYAEHRSSHG